jgi:hypothetical protein
LISLPPRRHELLRAKARTPVSFGMTARVAQGKNLPDSAPLSKPTSRLPRRTQNGTVGGVKTNSKPANSKARALLKKLQALAERGIDGEKVSAQRKIRRLKARFDFSGPEPVETPDLFSGSFKRSAKARPICSFGPNEFEVANAVKWAIESATSIQCVHRNRVLLAEASSATARRLEEIALHIASSFRALLDKFGAVGGVSVDDRGVFVMGLYDGMMNEVRNAGQSLPSRPGLAKRQKGRKRTLSRAAGLHVHPYTLAVGLGKQIRFSAPVAEIAAELEGALRKCLPQEHADSPPPPAK